MLQRKLSLCRETDRRDDYKQMINDSSGQSSPLSVLVSPWQR